MAENETRRIIEVETRQVGMTLSDLATEVDKARKNVDNLREAVKDGTASQEQYEQGLVSLRAAQQRYNQEMRVQTKEVQAVKGSYNDLVQQLARLKEQWKAAKPGTDQYNKLISDIEGVKGRLESMDHDIGNWQRNVGNYTNSIMAALGRIGPGGRQAAAGIGTATTALKAMSATPVVFVLTSIVALLGKVSGAMKGSEEATNKMNVALAPLNAILHQVATSLGEAANKAADLALRFSEAAISSDTFLNSLIQRAKGIGDGAVAAIAAVSPGLAGLIDSLKDMDDAAAGLQQRTAEEIKIANQQASIDKFRRAVEVQNAQDMAEAARLRTDAAKAEGAEKKALLEQVEQKYGAVTARNLKLAKEEYDLAVLRARQAPNNKAVNDALAAAEAKLYQVRQEYYQRTMRTAAGIAAAERGMTKEHTDQTAALEKLTEVQGKWLDKMDIGIQKQLDAKKAAEEEAKVTAELLGDDSGFLEGLQSDLDTMNEMFIQSTIDARDAEEKALKDRQQNIQDFAKSVSSIMDDVAGAYQSQIKTEVEAGKISEEEGEKRFKAVKALQYANTILNTYAAVQAVMADPTPKPTALRYVEAAAALASGIANAVKIANTTLGNTQKASASGQGVQQINTAAPVTQEVIHTTRIVTNAEDEQRLNQAMQTNIHAYVVTSELEGQLKGVQDTMTESGF